MPGGDQVIRHSQPPAPTPAVLSPDELDAWADAHEVGVSEITPGHWYAVWTDVASGVVEVRMAFGRTERAAS
jgi:hypothetical protein